MRRGVAWLLGAWLLSSGIAEAGEVTLGAETRVGYDSNVFNRSDDSGGDVDSAVIMLRARGQVRDELERGEYLLRYVPTYFINVASEANNYMNHQANLSGTYHFSPRTQVTLADEFQFIEKIVFSPEDSPSGSPPPAGDPDFDDQNRRTIRNSASVGGRHLLTPRWSVFSGGAYTIYRYSRSNEQDNELVTGNLGTSYALNQRTRIGAGGGMTYRTFEGTSVETATGVPLCFGEESPRPRSLSYSGYAFVGYELDDTTHFEAQAGPARIESDRYVCGQFFFPPDPFFRKIESNQTTWFASGVLSKRWQRVKASLRYRRSEGLGGASETTVNDTLVGRADWTPARFWHLGARGGWIQRDASLSSKTTTWTAALQLSRQFLRRLRGSVVVSYRNQYSNVGARDFDTWRASVGLRYDLDPIRY